MKRKYVWYRRDRKVVKATYWATEMTMQERMITLSDSGAVVVIIHLGEGEFIEVSDA